MNSSLVANIVRAFISDLKSEESIAYGDHNNLWIDFGWDISAGNGEISEIVTDRVAFFVESMSPTIREYLWWCSSSGSILGKEIENMAEKNPKELNNLMGPTREEIIEDVTEILTSCLRERAEADYDIFSESDWDDEDNEDNEEDDWDDEDEE